MARVKRTGRLAARARQRGDEDNNDDAAAAEEDFAEQDEELENDEEQGEEEEDDDDDEYDDYEEELEADGGPAAKKAKTDTYRDGAIVRMNLKNFVTYNSVEFFPGPSLNVVIGPNGTGKSSIVCAMALVLAGNPGLLGRETKASAFIRTGENTATIEAELFRSRGPNMVIRRVIQKGNRSSFTINGKAATERKVRKTVGKMNIQIDNLCQFLPQDKVSAFAKKSPQELLVDTQRAADSEGLLHKHLRLIDLNKKLKGLNHEVSGLEEQINEDEAENQTREEERKRWDELQQQRGVLRLIEQKMPWMEYESAREPYVLAKQEFDTVSQKLKASLDQLKPFKAALSSAVKRREKAKLAVDGVKPLLTKLQRALNALRERGDAFSDKLVDVNSQLETFANDQRKAKEKAMEHERRAKEFEERMSALRKSSDIQAEVRALRAKENEFTRPIDGARDELADVEASKTGRMRALQQRKHQLQATEDMFNRKRAAVEKRQPWLRNAIDWVNEMNTRLEQGRQDGFRKHVFLPLVMNINVGDQHVAALVEHSIPGRDRIAFLCQTEEDQRLLVRTLRTERRLPINAVRIPPDNLSAFNPPLSPQEAGKFGIDGFLLDHVEAPERVKVYLAKVLYFHQTPFAARKSPAITERLQESGFKNFYSGMTSYRVMSSRFSRRSDAMRLDEVRRPQYLSLSIDTRQRDQLIREIRDLEEQIERFTSQQQQLQATIKEHEDERIRYTQRIAALQEERKKVVELSGKIKRCETVVENSRHRIAQVEEQRVAKENEMRELAASASNLWSQLKQKANTLVEKMDTRTVLDLQLEQAKLQEHRAREELRQKEDELKMTQSQVDVLRAKMQELKRVAKSKLEAAKASNGGKMLTEKQKDEFAGLPQSLDELQNKHMDIKAQIQAISDVDENVVAEYEQTRKRLEQRKLELAGKQTDLQQVETAMTELGSAWETALGNIVKDISSNFSSFFQELGCSGSVDISKDEDYAEWGIEIRVSFRDGEPLQPLRAHHQSGGERSVATMLYLMSLQRLTKCPFRVVDEINQGMDATNEKRVFEQVVNSSTAEASQYFLITPKLLPNLPYSPQMKVLCVYNGPHMLSHSKWRLDGFLAARRRLALTPA